MYTEPEKICSTHNFSKDRNMKRHVILIAAIWLLAPAVLWGAELGSDGTTIFRFEERSFPGSNKERVAPATQFLGVDIGKLGDPNLSFHLYGWGRVDLASHSTSEGSTDGIISYAYLHYRFPEANAFVKAGRLFVYEGVAAEQLDGVSLRTDLAKGFTLALYGGVPVRVDENNNKGSSIFGGRVGYRLPGMLELGVSALREGGTDTREFDTSSLTARTIKRYREMIGGDIWLSPYRTVELNGHTYYNAASEGIAEHSYLASWRPLTSLNLFGEYNEQRFKEYFGSTNLPSLFQPARGDHYRSTGIGVTYAVAKPVELTADYKRINYQKDNHGKANRFGVEARLSMMDKRLRSGVSYHRSDGTGDGINSYHELRGYGMYAVSRYSASLDAITHLYDKPINKKKSAFELVASLGLRILPALLLSGDLSYGHNPRYDSEVKGLLRLTYNFASDSKGARK